MTPNIFLKRQSTNLDLYLNIYFFMNMGFQGRQFPTLRSPEVEIFSQYFLFLSLSHVLSILPLKYESQITNPQFFQL